MGGAGGRFEGVTLELLDMISASSLTPRKRHGTWILELGTKLVVLYQNAAGDVKNGSIHTHIMVGKF